VSSLPLSTDFLGGSFMMGSEGEWASDAASKTRFHCEAIPLSDLSSSPSPEKIVPFVARYTRIYVTGTREQAFLLYVCMWSPSVK